MRYEPKASNLSDIMVDARTLSNVKNMPNSYFIMLLSISIGFAASSPLQQNTALLIPSGIAGTAALIYKILMYRNGRIKKNNIVNNNDEN